MRASKLRAITVIAVLLLAGSVCCHAVTYDTQLTGTIGTLDLHAEANWTGTIWQYTYTLTYTQSTVGGIIKTFQVENPYQVPYLNSNNSLSFTNPAYDPMAYSLDWINGRLAPGETAVFSYESLYVPEVGQTFTLTVDAGQNAGGLTLGMSDTMVPEPGSFAVLGAMASGALFSLRRRRR